MKHTLLVVDCMEDIVDKIVHYRHSIKIFLCRRRGDFVVVINLYSAFIKSIETSVWGEFVSISSSSVIYIFSKG